ncbi:hypothetical protein BD289DRAFT_438259 [Coniella lustricola]|uniref:Uncharacterized protein n=1 Tax=Coniella lustricola TaxID=2025994 RepID=A0A2T3A344_9PEZI|nr:hypothetical protein BD289DRAFT_438259 [Coniella lustricola]
MPLAPSQGGPPISRSRQDRQLNAMLKREGQDARQLVLSQRPCDSILCEHKQGTGRTAASVRGVGHRGAMRGPCPVRSSRGSGYCTTWGRPTHEAIRATKVVCNMGLWLLVKLVRSGQRKKAKKQMPSRQRLSPAPLSLRLPPAKDCGPPRSIVTQKSLFLATGHCSHGGPNQRMLAKGTML